MKVEIIESQKEVASSNYADKLIAFNVNGKSMEPTIESGDMVLCEHVCIEEIEDNNVYAIVTSSCVWVKRIQKLCDESGIIESLKLISDNVSEFDPFVVNEEDIKTVLKVKKRITGLKDF